MCIVWEIGVDDGSHCFRSVTFFVCWCSVPVRIMCGWLVYCVCVFLNDDGVSLIMMELKKASVNLVLVLYVTI